MSDHDSIRAVCVYCGSSPGNDPAYVEAGEKLGCALAESGLALVFGGGALGIMGAVARGTLQVTFRPDTLTSSWVPDVMTERYDILNDRGDNMGTITGRAAYSNARRFRLSEHAEDTTATP